MWVHSEEKTDDISFHDCRATQARIDNHDLWFEFADGFWICGDTKNNRHDKTLRTDRARLRISGYDISDVYIFKDIRLFRRLVSTQRISIDLNTLLKNINSGKWALEFIYEYHTFQGVMFLCYIWFKSKPYCRECQLFIENKGMECFWNNLREDCPW